jgi:D-alanyl-D-alanine carboxypeptidase (penicillin-binding protein 5/6)
MIVLGLGSTNRRLGYVAVIALVLCIVFSGHALAQAKFESKAKWAILVDANTNSVLFEQNPDDLMPPASMSKLMTLAVVFRALKDGRLAVRRPAHPPCSCR